MPSDLKERIQAATLKSLKSRNRYNDSITAQLTQSLNKAEQEVAQAILKYRSLGSLPDNKLAALKGLEKLQGELDDVLRQLKRDQTLVFRKSTKDAFKGGIAQGITELTSASLPFYADLKAGGIDKLATKVEQAGIEGLPISAQVDQLTEHRFSIELASYRLLLDQQLKMLSIINPSGSIDILGITRIEGVGETITVRILADGAKGFSCAESGHGGLIESGGTIHLSMKNGTSLIIRFPGDGSGENDDSTSCQGLCNLKCEERDL